MTFLVDGTLGGTFPSWTTATRPASPAVGQMGYNTTTGLFDQYIAAGWTSVGAATGTVLQVVNVAYSTATTNSTSTYADTGLTATITPKFSTSKILILVDQAGCYKDGSNAASQFKLQLLRNSTSVITYDFGATYTGTTVQNNVGSVSTNYLDSPATTSAIIYKTQFLNYNNTALVSVQTNGSTSTITLMEIAA